MKGLQGCRLTKWAPAVVMVRRAGQNPQFWGCKAVITNCQQQSQASSARRRSAATLNTPHSIYMAATQTATDTLLTLTLTQPSHSSCLQARLPLPVDD